MVSILGDVVVEPAKAFRRFAEPSPHWVWTLCLLATVSIAIALPPAVYLRSAAGREAISDAQLREYERVRSRFKPEQYERMLAVAHGYRESMWLDYAIRNVFGNMLFVGVFSGLFCYLFAPFLSAPPNYQQVVGIASLASFVSLVESLFVTGLNVLNGTLILRGNIGDILPVSLPEALAHINPFTLWWICVFSIGVGTVASTKWRVICLPLIFAYLCFAMAFAFGPESQQLGLPNFH